jgi:hypothetical protein
MNAWHVSEGEVNVYGEAESYYHYGEEMLPYIIHDPNDGDDLFVVKEKPHPDIDYTDPDTNGPPDEEGLVFEIFGTLEAAQRYVEQVIAEQPRQA